MSVSFDLLDPSTRTLLDTEFGLNLSNLNAAIVGNEIGLVQYADSDHMSGGGECTARQLRECLLHWPDGHPDPYVHSRLSGLIELMNAAERTDKLIGWA